MIEVISYEIVPMLFATSSAVIDAPYLGSPKITAVSHHETSLSFPISIMH